MRGILMLGGVQGPAIDEAPADLSAALARAIVAGNPAAQAFVRAQMGANAEALKALNMRVPLRHQMDPQLFPEYRRNR